MEDWQKDLGDFNKGLADSHESRQPWNKLNQNMQMGRRAGGHDNAESAPPSKGGVWSGIVGLFGLAGFVIGLLLGGNLLNNSWTGVVMMLGSAALGLVVGMAPPLLLESGIRAIYRKSLWRRQARENTADGLARFWDTKYGAPPMRDLIDAVDGNGSAWIMDGKGNFILQMRNGKKLFVGHERDDNGEMRQVVRKEGKGG